MKTMKMMTRMEIRTARLLIRRSRRMRFSLLVVSRAGLSGLDIDASFYSPRELNLLRLSQVDLDHTAHI